MNQVQQLWGDNSMVGKEETLRDGLADFRGAKKGDPPADFTGLAAGVAGQPWTWTGSDFAGDSRDRSFVLQLAPEDVENLEESLCAFKKLELDGDQVDRHNFPLPTLQRKLEQVANDIHQGCGFSIVRGLDPNRYSVEDNLILFLGVANYIGDVRGVQDRKGNMISHVTDSKLWKVSRTLRHGIHTNTNLPFHNDMGTDILALQVRQCAPQGGNTYIASASQLFGELAQTDPETARTLMEPNWPIQVSGNPARFVLAPLAQHHDGKIVISVDPGRLGLHPAAAATPGKIGSAIAPTVPPLSHAQQQALDTLSILATKHRLRLDTQPGDLVFVNNWAHLHARDSYADAENDDGPRRHLVRLWLRNSKLGWSVPAGMRVPWVAAFGPDGAGDKSTSPDKMNFRGWNGAGEVPRLYPVVPPLEYKVPKYTAGSAAFILEDSDSEDGE